MAKLKFKDENNEFIPVVQDVKLNDISVFDGKDANIKLKTINNQNITGNGNIEIDVEDVVKTTANQGLTTQQKINARNNIEALGNSNIKQGTGTSTTDVISQKGITDLLGEKQSRVPNGTNPLISIDTGKLDLIYMPATVLGGITNGGTFNSQGIINASSYAPELQGEKIDEVQFASYPSYYFICADDYSFAGFDFTVGDWAISLGNGWAKLNATDAVTSVNGKMGQVVLNADDVQAAPLFFGVDNANKNLVTDYLGMVTTSDYALGQIIVDYYQELPNVNPDLPQQNIPERARATVLQPSDELVHYNNSQLQNAYDLGEELGHEVKIYWTPERPYAHPQYAYFDNGSNSFSVFFDDQISPAACYWIEYYEEQTGNPVWFAFSWSAQRFLPDESGNTNLLSETWTKVTYDSSTDTYSSEQAQWEDLPMLNGPVYVTDLLLEDDIFSSNFIWLETKLAGEYTYFKVEPETTPTTYYWGYTPSNVQADMEETDTASLAYVKNKPKLRTNFTTTLRPEAEEEIIGTINLHKISKTGQYSDLKNQVGMKDENNPSGEIFGTYSGIDINVATGTASAAFGSKSEATAHSAFVEGSQNHATGTSSHAEGNATRASNMAAHSEGQFTIADGNSSHAEGASSRSSGTASHAEGDTTYASGSASHAEGANTSASSNYAHAEGQLSSASGLCSHAEGYNSTASGQNSHAEGYTCRAQALNAHAEGYQTYAQDNAAHSEGNLTYASGSASHAEGYGTVAQSSHQHVQGKYNIVDATGTYAHIIGNGTADNARSNAHTVDWNGNAWYQGEIRTGGTSYANATTMYGVPVLPNDASTKTYVLKAINGIMQWIKETDIENNTLIFY